jgi:hypothetical protein
LRHTKAQLDALVEEATVDAFNEDEQLTGLYTLMDEHLAVPFESVVLGVPATVRRIDLVDGGIVGVCSAGGNRQRIPILDLPLPDPPPEGAEWIEAYRHWRRGFRG